MIKLHNNYNVVYDYNGTTGNIYSNQNWSLFYNRDISHFADGCSKLNYELNGDNINYIINGTNTVGHINFQYVENMSYAFNGCTLINGSPVITPNAIDMSYAYQGCKNLIGSPYCGNNTINMCGAYTDCIALNGSPVCSDSVKDFYDVYKNCNHLKGNVVCGANVSNMANAYWGCSLVNGEPKCGYNATNMHNAYYGCLNVTGTPVCGDHTTDFSGTYGLCGNLTGSPACGGNVTTMAGAYSSCVNLHGSPNCGSNVINMYEAYSSCFNLIGSPACGSKVVDMNFAYAYCRNLTGAAVCGDSVINMQYSYYGCTNLTSIAPMMNNVINMQETYRDCNNISGETYIHSESINSMCRCFYNHNNDYSLILHIKRKCPIDKDLSNWYNGKSYSENVNLFGKDIKWAKIPTNNGYRNSEFNILIYNNLNHTIGHYVVPSQSSNLYYSASYQSPSWKDYHSDAISMVTKNTNDALSAINTGTYTAWAQLINKENSVWDIGGEEIIDDQQVTWSIQKCASTIEFDKSYVEQQGDESYYALDFSRVDPYREATLTDYIVECYDKTTGELIPDSDDAEIRAKFNFETGKSSPTLYIYYWMDNGWKSCPGSYTIKVHVKETQNYLQSNTFEISTAVNVGYIDIPVQTSVPSFTGNDIYPTWDDTTNSLLDSGYIKVTVTPQKIPGTYTATFDLVAIKGKYRYIWKKEPSTGSQIINWTINKASSNAIQKIIYNGTESSTRVTVVFSEESLIDCVYIVPNTSEYWNDGYHGELISYSSNDMIAKCTSLEYITSGEHLGQYKATIESTGGGNAVLEFWFQEGNCYLISNSVYCDAISSVATVVLFKQFQDNDSNISSIDIEFI